MRNLSLLGLLATLLASVAPVQAMIKPQTSDDVFREALSRHSIRFRPAPKHAKLVKVTAKKARTWDEARAHCRELSPAGAHDLPTLEQYVNALMTKSVDVRIELDDMGAKTAIHPMWLRDQDEATNQDNFSGTSIVMTITSDGAHVQGVDVSPEGVANFKKALAEIERILKHEAEPNEKAALESSKGSLKKLIATFQDGYPAYCSPR